jgi:signal peptidase
MFIVFIVVIALLLIISIFPITGNIKFMVVQSGSMEPAIKMGSVVMVRPVNDYKIGDIITFGEITKIKSPTTHRIDDMKVIEGEVYYITKGDANNASDQKGVSKKEIIGKVLIAVPYLGFAIDFAKKPIGFALIIIVPALLVIFDEVKNIIKEIKKKKISL